MKQEKQASNYCYVTKILYWNDPTVEITILGYRKQNQFSIFISSIEELSISSNKFYHTIPNFTASYANQVSLQFKNKIYIFKFLIGVGTVFHL